ncbi:MAG: helix-turn-helix transcriptional regulator [Phycisphaerales bacterium]|nr:helix-turn-helix transcriptional regulator [Phycisphaerales bacterium]MCB9841176.1 helix-turn-helix transcriptional regulator [Phycisphaeraceae bacterium]
MIQALLGKRIAELRVAKGISQEKLASISGYSTEFISLVERGRNAPSVAGLARIAKGLGVEVKELFEFAKGSG